MLARLPSMLFLYICQGSVRNGWLRQQKIGVLLQKNCQISVLSILLQLQEQKKWHNMICKPADAEHELGFKLECLWEYFSSHDVQKGHN